MHLQKVSGKGKRKCILPEPIFVHDPALDRQSKILAILGRLVPPACRIELGRDSTKNRSRIPKNSSHDTLTKRTQSNSKPDVKSRSKNETC